MPRRTFDHHPQSLAEAKAWLEDEREYVRELQGEGRHNTPEGKLSDDKIHYLKTVINEMEHGPKWKCAKCRIMIRLLQFLDREEWPSDELVQEIRWLVRFRGTKKIRDIKRAPNKTAGGRRRKEGGDPEEET